MFYLCAVSSYFVTSEICLFASSTSLSFQSSCYFVNFSYLPVCFMSSLCYFITLSFSSISSSISSCACKIPKANSGFVKGFCFGSIYQCFSFFILALYSSLSFFYSYSISSSTALRFLLNHFYFSYGFSPLLFLSSTYFQYFSSNLLFTNFFYISSALFVGISSSELSEYTRPRTLSSESFDNITTESSGTITTESSGFFISYFFGSYFLVSGFLVSGFFGSYFFGSYFLGSSFFGSYLFGSGSYFRQVCALALLLLFLPLFLPPKFSSLSSESLSLSLLSESD